VGLCDKKGEGLRERSGDKDAANGEEVPHWHGQQKVHRIGGSSIRKRGNLDAAKKKKERGGPTSLSSKEIEAAGKYPTAQQSPERGPGRSWRRVVKLGLTTPGKENRKTREEGGQKVLHTGS